MNTESPQRRSLSTTAHNIKIVSDGTITLRGRDKQSIGRKAETIAGAQH
jgi:non-ribosomal peptide synthetase component E (peptide arylation enzyme)